MRAATLIATFAAVMLAAPLASFAQENSIMQSFHPELKPAPKTEAVKQKEPAKASDSEAKVPSEQRATPPAEK